MASNKNLKHLEISIWDGGKVLNVGEMEIWDGADLALLRETMTRLVEEEGCRSLGVDMSFVKYVPSGFFGMLFDWFEQGVCIRLFSPQPHVQRMLWFTKFFHQIAENCHELWPETEIHGANGVTAVPQRNTVAVIESREPRASARDSKPAELYFSRN